MISLKGSDGPAGVVDAARFGVGVCTSKATDSISPTAKPASTKTRPHKVAQPPSVRYRLCRPAHGADVEVSQPHYRGNDRQFNEKNSAIRRLEEAAGRWQLHKRTEEAGQGKYEDRGLCAERVALEEEDQPVRVRDGLQAPQPQQEQEQREKEEAAGPDCRRDEVNIVGGDGPPAAARGGPRGCWLKM